MFRLASLGADDSRGKGGLGPPRIVGEGEARLAGYTVPGVPVFELLRGGLAIGLCKQWLIRPIPGGAMLYQRFKAASSAALAATHSAASMPISFFQNGARDFR